MRSKIKVLFITAFVLTIIGSNSLAADVQNEVSHLLNYIENSGCTFIRNDKNYNSLKARRHLERKYNYVKSRLKSAEDFIKHIASKSSRTDKTYFVECNGKSFNSTEWLTEELYRFRKTAEK